MVLSRGHCDVKQESDKKLHINLKVLCFVDGFSGGAGAAQAPPHTQKTCTTPEAQFATLIVPCK